MRMVRQIAGRVASGPHGLDGGLADRHDGLADRHDGSAGQHSGSAGQHGGSSGQHCGSARGWTIKEETFHGW